MERGMQVPDRAHAGAQEEVMRAFQARESKTSRDKLEEASCREGLA